MARAVQHYDTNRSLYGHEPTHKGYAIEYHFKTRKAAFNSSLWALKKFKDERNRPDIQEVIKHMTLFASNKAQGMSENHRLSKKQRDKFHDISRIYKAAYFQMHTEERQRTYEHADHERHKKSRFPLHPHTGEHHSITREVHGEKRKLTYEATGHNGMERGLPKWVMVKNEPA